MCKQEEPSGPEIAQLIKMFKYFPYTCKHFPNYDYVEQVYKSLCRVTLRMGPILAPGE